MGGEIRVVLAINIAPETLVKNKGEVLLISEEKGPYCLYFLELEIKRSFIMSARGRD